MSGTSADSSLTELEIFGLLQLLLYSSPSSLFSSLPPAFGVCPVIIAANQFNLGNEADVLMRMERC